MARSIIHVHHRGDRGVDGILKLIELAGHDGPLESALAAMCEEIAAIACVDVASIYVREGDALVMRGNVGLSAAAIGTSLAIGEGITGLVAECMRPVSAAHAAGEAAYKYVPGIGEEKFPVFTGVPLISGGAVAGVLVVQRRKRAMTAAEVTLATALAAPITLALERRRASAVRAARLVGTALAGGVVLGRAGVVPTTTSLPATPLDVDRALGRLRDDLGRAVRRLADCDDPQVGGALDRLALSLCDQRLRERLVAAAGDLRAVVKDYVRAPYKLGLAGDEDGAIEELCALIGIVTDERSSAKPGAVWIADHVGAVVAIGAVARGAAAIVTSAQASPTAIAIARAAKLPLVAEVAGIFGWARAGDLLAVDGDRGVVLVHPAPSEIERLRRER